MTRKCVLCKESNYRNTYSFFSAPKDPDTRKKWQNAIGIENYAVTDDTYVCSKHFHKDDIITHWVSGVPPHVITIKYKKCRLRPGAVPSRSYPLEKNSNDRDHSDDSDVHIDNYSLLKLQKTAESEEKEKNFLIPRSENNLQINCDVNHRVVHHEFSHSFKDYNYTSNRSPLIKIELPKNGSNTSILSREDCKIEAEECSIIYNGSECEESQTRREDTKKTNSSKMFSISEGDDTSMDLWEHKRIKKETFPQEISIDNNFKSIQSQIVDNLNYNQVDTYYSTYNDVEENEMLFEDLLEVCTEVLLPPGWSSLVTSKGHSTTIVYLYMSMTKSGMPYTEKQVFIKSDMILRCSAVNREINPLIHNLIREGKHLKVQNLLDIEELIDEFNQRTVCQGMYNTEGFQKVNGLKIAYKDGVKWRHVLCPLIINNDSLRCTKCITLSTMWQRKSTDLLSFTYKPPTLTGKQQKVYSIRQRWTRTRKHDRRYEFIKVFKE